MDLDKLPLTAFKNEDPSITPQDKLALFDSVPLFMKSLPSELGGTESQQEFKLKQGDTNPSDTLAALQALTYEGDPSEIAQGFKEQGNDLFKRKKFRDALGFYNRALQEVGKELSIRERRTLYSNASACNLELKNFGQCLKDCSQVFSQSPETVEDSDDKTTLKTLLRSARALLGLDKLPEAKDALERLRTLELELNQKQQPQQEDLDVGKPYRELVESKLRLKREKELEFLEKQRRSEQGNESLLKALELRNVVFPKPTNKKPLFSLCPTDVTPPHFEPSSLPLTSSPSIPYFPPSTTSTTSTAPYIPWVSPPPTCPLVFPIFLLLPLALPQPTRDLCLSFDERSSFKDLLESMDHSHLSLDLYLSTFKGRVLKIGGKLTLGKVLELASRPKQGDDVIKDGRDGWELKEGWAFEVVGIPKGDPRGEDWIKEWKEEIRNGTKAIL
jgi:tetratricopeptide (TPR) repeat protein